MTRNTPRAALLALTLGLAAGCGEKFPADSGDPGATTPAPHVETIRRGGWHTDDDGDGYSEAEGDCDDGWPGTNPGNPDEWRDGMDNNCNGYSDEGCAGAAHNERC